MRILINNNIINPTLVQVPGMNYGQIKRWKDSSPDHYSIELAYEIFLNRITDFFAEFRNDEIEDNDTSDFPELAAYKNAGWPKLNQLTKNHQDLFKDLIIYNQYEILQLILNYPLPRHTPYYSVNSLDEVLLESDTVTLCGTCFKVVL